MQPVHPGIVTKITKLLRFNSLDFKVD